MQNLLNRYEKHYGYKTTVRELYELYTQGGISLNTTDENTLIKAAEKLGIR